MLETSWDVFQAIKCGIPSFTMRVEPSGVLVGVVKMGENVVCDDGQENDSEEQEKDADEIDQENDIADVLRFADTLLANLRKTKSRGKELLKWEGKI